MGKYKYNPFSGNLDLTESGYEIPVSMDINDHIGGRHSYNTYAEIEAIPVGLRKPGMAGYVNSSLNQLTPANLTEASWVSVYLNGKVYFPTDSGFKIIDVANNTVSTINHAGGKKYFLRKTDTKLYFSVPLQSQIVELDSVTQTISRSVILAPVTSDVISGGFIAGNKLYIGDSYKTGVNYIHIIDLADFTASKVKSVDGTIDLVVGEVGSMAYDTNRQKLYVFGGGATTGAENRVYVVDTTTNNLITTIELSLISGYYTGNNNHNNFFFSASNKVFAVSRGSNTVFSINTETDTLEDEIALPPGSAPTAGYIVGAKFFVCNFEGSSLSVIDMVNGVILNTITLESGPGGGTAQVAFHENRLFVPNYFAQTISVVNTVTNSLVGTFPLPGAPRSVSYAENTNKVYVSINTATEATILQWNPGELYILQPDGQTWEKSTPISKAGDLVYGLVEYTKDFFDFMGDRTFADIGSVKRLLNEQSVDLETAFVPVYVNEDLVVPASADYYLVEQFSYYAGEEVLTSMRLVYTTLYENQDVYLKVIASTGEVLLAETRIPTFQFEPGINLYTRKYISEKEVQEIEPLIGTPTLDCRVSILIKSAVEIKVKNIIIR